MACEGAAYAPGCRSVWAWDWLPGAGSRGWAGLIAGLGVQMRTESGSLLNPCRAGELPSPPVGRETQTSAWFYTWGP